MSNPHWIWTGPKSLAVFLAGWTEQVVTLFFGLETRLWNKLGSDMSRYKGPESLEFSCKKGWLYTREWAVFFITPQAPMKYSAPQSVWNRTRNNDYILGAMDAIVCGGATFDITIYINIIYTYIYNAYICNTNNPLRWRVLAPDYSFWTKITRIRCECNPSCPKSLRCRWQVRKSHDLTPKGSVWEGKPSTYFREI